MADSKHGSRNSDDGLVVSQLATGPIPGLQLIRQLIAEDESPAKLVYVVSDFRAKEWRNPAELRSALLELQGADAEVELISCARQGREISESSIAAGRRTARLGGSARGQRDAEEFHGTQPSSRSSYVFARITSMMREALEPVRENSSHRRKTSRWS
jgi:hypothetical protein